MQRQGVGTVAGDRIQIGDAGKRDGAVKNRESRGHNVVRHVIIVNTGNIYVMENYAGDAYGSVFVNNLGGNGGSDGRCIINVRHDDVDGSTIVGKHRNATTCIISRWVNKIACGTG